MTQSKAKNDSTVRHIVCDKLTNPLPIFSHATIHHGVAYISCIQGFIPGSFEMPEDPYDQAKQALENLEHVVEQVGSTMRDVLKIVIFMKDMNDFEKINAAINEAFPESPPARSSIAVADLPKNAKVVVECVAAVVEG